MLQSIQIGRAVAVLGVMLIHLEWVYNDIQSAAMPWESAWLLVGGYGVDLFFVISGFIIAYLLSKKEWSARDFLLRRIIRIYPLYWAFTLSYMAAVSVGCGQGERGDCGQPLELSSVASSLLILPLEGYPALSVGWSLEHEIIFYAIACIVCVTLRLSIRVLLLVVVLLGCVGAVVHAIVPELGGGSTWDYHLFSLYHFEFAAGIAVFLARHRLAKTHFLLLIALAAAVFGLTAVVTDLMPGPRENIEFSRAGLPGLVSVLGYAIASAALLAGLLGAEARGLLRRGSGTWPLLIGGIVLVGDASYGLYLVQPLAYGVIGKMYGSLDLGTTLVAPALVIALAATIVAGTLWYRIVERPFLDVAHRSLGRPRLAGTAP